MLDIDLPWALRKAFGKESMEFVSEIVIDFEGRIMRETTANTTLRNVFISDEISIVREDQNDPQNSTLMEQVLFLDAPGLPKPL